MKRRNFLQALAAAAALGAGSMARAANGRPLNFVFFLADDLGWTDVGYNGSSFYDTPAMDRLAREGMVFTDAYAACPVCSPTRASILTGQYPARIGVTDYIGGFRSGRLIPPPNLNHLPLEQVTIAEALAPGYQNWFIGKWHLGGEGYYPDEQGFDCNVGGTWSGMPNRSYFSPYHISTLPDGPPGEYLTDRLTEEAVKRIDGAGDRPFLLYLSHFAVHVPLQAKEDMVKRYKQKRAARGKPTPTFARIDGHKTRVAQDHAVYAAMIESLDESLGKVMDALDRTGRAENTVIIFMSDNGGLSTAEGWPTSNLPLRGGKGWLYEGGIREPMIIKWPGRTRAGTVCAEPVTSTDFYPTMLEMAGLPPLPEQHCDGRSLVPLIDGAKSLGREAIFWHYPHYSNQGGRPAAAVRAGDWKLIEFFEDGHTELYNLRDDVGEHHDLTRPDPGRTARLKGLLHEWFKQVNAQMPKRNPLDPRNLLR